MAYVIGDDCVACGLCLLVCLTCAIGAGAQKRKVMNRPYLDMRKLHYGFLIGLHFQDMEMQNNGYPCGSSSRCLPGRSKT